MKYALRDGNIITPDDSQDRFLEKLYTTGFGLKILDIIIQPVISKIGGFIMSLPISKFFIKSFIKKNEIDMSQYEEVNYNCYNDFFTRKIKSGARSIDMDPAHLISPCDSKLTVYDIDDNCILPIKGTNYNIFSLLRDRKLADKYRGGKALVFRLTVDDYHRYIYVDNGAKSSNRTVEGVFHTVNPIAASTFPIYRENHREYTMLRTDNFGDVIQLEVGALMVGKIRNYHYIGKVSRGEEKGYFEFGGSTIVVLLEKDKAVIDEDIINNTAKDIETRVLMGERIGCKMK
ncbi:MAG: phosphatidylserine decarboxylase [Lachnospiraceae bacterium]|nr:phosphatidylserine decarboxylase [Lachnospiraceae bacterium]